MSLLGQGDTFAKLGDLIGGDATQAETAVETAGPAMLGGLAERAAGEGGPEAVSGLLDEVDPTVTDDVDGFLDGADPEAGNGLLDSLFGADRTGLLDGLAARSGLDAGMFAQLLPRLAPLFVGALAKRRAESGLDAAGVAGLLSQERDGLETDGKLGDWFAGLLGGGGALAAVSGLGARAKGLLGDAVDEIKDRFDGDDDDASAATLEDGVSVGEPDGAEPVGDDAASDEGDGDADEDEDEDGDGDEDGEPDDGPDDEVVSGAADDDDEIVIDPTQTAEIPIGAADLDPSGPGVGTLAAGAGVAAGATAVAASSSPTATAVRDRAAAEAEEVTVAGGGRSGWLRWVIGAVVLVALLALLLSQCSKSSTSTSPASTSAPAAPSTSAAPATSSTTAATSTTAAPSTTAAGAGDAALATLVQRALAGADLGTGVKAAVANGVVTLTGSVATQEAKAAAEAAVKAVAGVARIDNQITVAAAAAPTDLQAKVRAVLPAGITAAVSGTVVTLTGTVDSEAAKEAAEKAVVAVSGVTKVDNQIKVTAATAPGTTLNDKLGLGPINFDYLSARILPPAAAELDKAVAWMQANPGNVEIQGYTDDDGPAAQNLELSQRRAASVKAYLVSKGIDGGRLSTVGFGEASPKVPNDSLDNKAINRRIELVLK